jgi:hypothetical protein
MDENPVEALAIINPKDRGVFSNAMYYLMRKADAAADYAREEPFKAVLFTAAGISALYGAYRLVMYPFPLWGAAIELNGNRYRMTNTDRLWMGRMVVGEAGESGWDDPATAAAKRRAGAAVLWSVATRHMTKPSFRGWTLTQTMRAFSQPINPIWASPLAEGCLRSPSACTPSRLERRLRITNAPWFSLPAGVRSLVNDFFRGNVENPVPGYNNFAGVGSIRSSAIAQSTLPATTIGGNTFLRDPGSIGGEVSMAGFDAPQPLPLPAAAVLGDMEPLRIGAWTTLAAVTVGGLWLFNTAYKEKEQLLRERRRSNPSRKRYYVKIKGEQVTYGPYTLKSAKSFARIGSQHGKDRYVRRDRPGGPRVRHYSDGKRVWPVRESQARGLLSSEQPRRLQSA